jgi:transposase
MNKHREALRLILTTSLSNRMIGRSVRLSHNTVNRYRRLVNELPIDWEAVNGLDDTDVEAILKSKRFRVESKHMPDWAGVHREMQYRDVTLQLLWEDYRLANPGNAYAYSQFTHYYRQYVGKLDMAMRQTHRAGECVYVDFAGRTVPYFDPASDEAKQAQVFVGALGCSNYAFVYALRSQSLVDWIEAHNRMYQFFGGTPQVVVPDNLKAAVTRAGREPELNRTYLEQAKHYQIAIVPARVRHPKDKSKAEVTVQIISRWILARLRHRRFFSIEEINAAIAELLRLLNDRPFKRLPGCRRSRFEELDKPLLRPLPTQPFEYAEWTSAHKIGPDYHMRVHDHYYSVPHALIGGHVEARVTANIVELFHQGKRVASHPRSYEVGGHTTDPAHQPTSHRHYAEQTPELIIKWARSIGPAAEAVIQYQFDSRPHALLGIRYCAPLQRLAKEYGAERFEAACQRAQLIGSLTTKSIRSILQRRLDTQSDPRAPIQVNLPLHDNVRGAGYYANGGQ